MQGYNAQTAATTAQIVIAAEVTVTSNDQPHFVPMATAVTENLTDAGHADRVGTFVADAGYWTAANGTTDVGAEVLIATKKTSWRKADKPDDDKLTVLAKVNRGELSQRKAGEILGVSYTWVRDMTKRYFGTEGQRITRSAEPEPEEWIPVIERVARGEISKRAARDELDVSDTRINAMLAHVRGEATDPAIARKAMDAKLAEPDNAELFTWWAPWRNMRERNIGWRIDYILASESLAQKAVESRVFRVAGEMSPTCEVRLRRR